MNRTASTLVLAVAAAFVATVAQAQTTTDEAREMASRTLAQQRLQTAFVKPQAQPVATGDYRAQAHEATRQANYRTMVESVLAYGSGARTQPIAVNSEDSARAEAARVGTEQRLAELHGLLATSAQARRDLEEGLSTGDRLARR